MADGRQSLAARVYRAVYRADRWWLAAIVVVVAGALAIYTWLAAATQDLAAAAFAGTSSGELVGEALSLLAAVVVLVVLSLAELALIDHVLICRAVARTQPLVLGHVVSWPLEEFEQRSPGDVRDVIVNLTTGAATSTASLVKPVIALTRGIFLLGLMATIDGGLTLVVVAVVALYAVFFFVVHRPVGAEMERQTAAERVASASVEDIHRNAAEIKRSSLEPAVLESFSHEVEPWFVSLCRYFRRVNTVAFGGDFLATLLPAALLISTAAGAAVGVTDPAGFVAVYVLSVLLAGLFRSLQTASRGSAAGAAQWRAVLGLLDVPTERSGGDSVPSADISWTDVTKRLRGLTVLDGVTLSIAAGEKCAVVGRSGQGKTTTLRMLPGLVEPDEGTVRVGGVDVRGADPSALRALVAVVTQDPYLFDATLADNLAPGADPDGVAEALALAQLADVVAGLPDGLDTYLGPGGHTLSGGEQARVALARAILRRPDILILDETFANLDSETEEAITTRIVELPCTVVAVTHRLASLAMFPRVVGLDRGRIVFDGPNAEVTGSEPFRRLFELSPSAPIEEAARADHGRDVVP